MSLSYPFADTKTADRATSLGEILDHAAVRMTFAKDEEIYGQEEEADLIYRVVSGVVRTARFLSDGRRQVGGFYRAGELFGLEMGETHRYAAEALTDCVVQVIKRSALRAEADEGELDRAIWNAVCRDLERAQEHVLLLGRKTACEKVASFLKELAEEADDAVELAMGRQDIADYLGLTIETVSRMLTQLQSTSVVEFAGCRQFRVRKWDVLERLAA